MSRQPRLRVLEAQLTYYTIRAPISGIISSVSTQEGETVAAGLNSPTFVTIIDLHKLQVDAFVDETDIGKIPCGQKATFTVDSFPDREFNATVQAIYPKAVIMDNVVYYDVVHRIDEPLTGQLRPEMTHECADFPGCSQGCPGGAAARGIERTGQIGRFVLRGDQPVRQAVKVGWKDAEWIEIVDGLKEGGQGCDSECAERQMEGCSLCSSWEITKTYLAGAVETPVLQGVTFEVDGGEFVAIMGASGTGKTTLMNILGCLDLPTGGTYFLDGCGRIPELTTTPSLRSAIRRSVLSFQQFHLLERASALDNVMLPLIYADKYPADAVERGRAALRAVGLGERLHYPPGQLSGGQQQRVAIARALVTNPALILADEPTGNLDRRSGLEVMAILQRLNREGRTVVLITHDQNIAEHAHRILTLRDGKIFEDAPSESFATRRRNSTRSLPFSSEKPAVLQGGAK